MYRYERVEILADLAQLSTQLGIASEQESVADVVHD